MEMMFVLVIMEDDICALRLSKYYVSATSPLPSTHSHSYSHPSNPNIYAALSSWNVNSRYLTVPVET